MATPDQLSIYNRAARILGERKLASLTEKREMRYILDDVWADNAVRECLEMGYWNFAMRTAQGNLSASIDPDFGYEYAFDKPVDWVRTAAVATDEFFVSPLLDYVDENNFWFASIQTIYIKYVSDDATYGTDYSLWSDTFTNFVAHYFAVQCMQTMIKNMGAKEAIQESYRKALTNAKGKDAMNEPTKFPATGNWVRARGGRWGSRRDRGSRGGLIG